MNELWRVQLGTGEVRMMTIDDLDRAFDAGFIHSRTNVLAPGSFTWTTLGDAAGLEDDQPYVEQTPSLSPMAIGGQSQYSLPAIPQHQPYSMSSFGLDDDDLYTKKSKKGVVFGFMVAAAVGACAILFSTGKLHSLQSAIASTHTESKVASATLAPAAEQKLPAPAAKPEEKKDDAAKPTIADDVKKKLLDADKEREAKIKAKAEKAGKGVRRRMNKGGDGNTNPAPAEGGKLIQGGDKYDPLNSSI